MHRSLYEETRAAAGRAVCPRVVIMDGQSVKTAERGGIRGFHGHKRVKGRKRHILADTMGCPSPTAWNQPTSRTAALARACWLAWALCFQTFGPWSRTPVMKVASAPANYCGKMAGSCRSRDVDNRHSE